MWVFYKSSCIKKIEKIAQTNTNALIINLNPIIRYLLLNEMIWQVNLMNPTLLQISYLCYCRDLKRVTIHEISHHLGEHMGCAYKE